VGAREASATLVHLIGLGAITVLTVTVPARSWGRKVERETTELRLVPGVANAKHGRGGGPQIRQGHIEGLTRIDRELLSLLFDRIAHCDHLTLAQIDQFSGRNPWAYWSAMKDWRDLVEKTCRDKGLLPGGQNALRATDVRRLRSELRTRIAKLQAGADPKPAYSLTSRLVELSVVFRLERALERSLRLPRGVSGDVSPSAGIDSARWLLDGQSSMRAPISTFTRSFMPFYSSGYAPAQYAVGSLPGHGTGGIGGVGGMSGASGGGGGFSGGGGDGGGGGGGGAG